MRSTSELIPPIFLWEPNDLDAFESVQQACAYLEHQDAKLGTCVGYDSKGRKLTFRVVSASEVAFGFSFGKREKVVLDSWEDESEHARELREILIKMLSALNRAPHPDSSLDEVVAEAAVCFRSEG